MARARGILWILTTAAARAASVHAADYGAPYAASLALSPCAATSGAFRGLAAQAAGTYAQAAALRGFCAPAAASSAPAAAPGTLLGSAVVPVTIGASGGGGGRGDDLLRRLGYGALATFAGALMMLTSDPIAEWDLVDEEVDAELLRLKHEWTSRHVEQLIVSSERDFLPSASRRPPSAAELRAHTEQLKILNRRMKEQFKERQNKDKDGFWELLEDLIKKGKLLMSGVELFKDARALLAGSVLLLLEQFADPVHYFVCPFSGHQELVYMFLFSVKPKDQAQLGDGSSVGSCASQVKNCSDNNKCLIHFSTCEVYSMMIGSLLHKEHPLRKDPELFVMTEEDSQCIFGSIVKQRCSYACSKQLFQSLSSAEGAENDLEFSTMMSFNWIGPRMEMVTEVYTNSSVEPLLGVPVIDVTMQPEGLDDTDKSPDLTLINKQKGWKLMTALKDLLEITLGYQHKTYKEAVKTQQSQASALR